MLFIPFPGATLWIRTPRDGFPDSHHLFILLTGAVGSSACWDEGTVALVSMSSVKPGVAVDTSCLLDVGDHPKVKHPSFVYYRKAELRTVDWIVESINSRDARVTETVDSGLLDRIIRGAHASPRTPRKVKAFLDAQALLGEVG